MRTHLNRQGLFAALAASSVLFLGGAAVGYSSITSEWARNSSGAVAAGGSLFGSTFSAILVQNLGVVLFLFSGVLTFGVSSVASLSMISIYVGATMSVATTDGGTGGVLADTGSYVGLELLGMLLAATAGLCPVFALLGRALRADPAPNQTSGATYVAAVRTSMATLGVSALLVLLAACIEAVVIASR
jgi:uncharacterized membrane protein SpoIIM required for sporulation